MAQRPEAPHPEPGQAQYIELVIATQASLSRVLLDGKDISQFVSRIVVDAAAGELTEVTLHCQDWRVGGPAYVVKGRLLVEPSEPSEEERARG